MSRPRRDFLLRSAVAASLAAWPRRAPWAATDAADVLVLEARDRVGGKVLTFADEPGLPAAGGQSIGSGYGRVVDAARLGGVELEDQLPQALRHPGMALVLDGKPVAPDAWMDHPRNPFPAALRELLPWQYTPRVMARANPPESVEDWFAPQRAVHDVSALMMAFVAAFTSAQRNLQPAVYEARDGNGVTVRTADGKRYAARAVVCAMPSSTLRDVRFDPALQCAQAQAVKTLPHQMATQVAVVARKPFWDGDRWPASMWADRWCTSAASRGRSGPVAWRVRWSRANARPSRLRWRCRSGSAGAAAHGSTAPRPAAPSAGL